MIEKAKYELDLLLKNCEDDESLQIQKTINNNILDIVEMFAKQGHSGFTAEYCIPIIEKLLKQSFITPLTGSDDEWSEVSPGLFQNIRESSIFKDAENFDGKPYYINGKAFSNDNGKTYFTNGDSAVVIEFPLNELPKTEYIILEGDEN